MPEVLRVRRGISRWALLSGLMFLLPASVAMLSFVSATRSQMETAALQKRVEDLEAALLRADAERRAAERNEGFSRESLDRVIEELLAQLRDSSTVTLDTAALERMAFGYERLIGSALLTPASRTQRASALRQRARLLAALGRQEEAVSELQLSVQAYQDLLAISPDDDALREGLEQSQNWLQQIQGNTPAGHAN